MTLEILQSWVLDSWSPLILLALDSWIFDSGNSLIFLVFNSWISESRNLSSSFVPVSVSVTACFLITKPHRSSRRPAFKFSTPPFQTHHAIVSYPCKTTTGTNTNVFFFFFKNWSDNGHLRIYGIQLTGHYKNSWRRVMALFFSKSVVELWAWAGSSEGNSSWTSRPPPAAAAAVSVQTQPQGRI